MENEKMKVEEGKTIPIPEIASPSLSQDESTPSAFTSRSEDSKQLKQINGDNTSPSSPMKNTSMVNSNVIKAKSCKGCLYYSSSLKARSRNPVCVGLTRSLPNAPRYVVGELEMEAYKAGRGLKDFRYGCVGYSVYIDQKERGHIETEKLPLCSGFEVLGDQLVDDGDSRSSSMTHTRNREDGNELPQRRPPKPTDSTREMFLSRFARNANVVANGVAKNMRRVGNQIKHSIEDVLYPYRRRPK